MLLYKLYYILLACLLAIDLYAFAEIYKVRRCVKANLVAALLQYRCKGVRCGTFAIGTGNMYGAVSAVRVA